MATSASDQAASQPSTSKGETTTPTTTDPTKAKESALSLPFANTVNVKLG